MAMLAEPRRKTKWTLNPRGKFWSDDSNKFGQKMLERMGWKEGKGLGANEQGMTTHIGIKVKSDNRGVGYQGKDTDWCRHQSEFDDILSRLSESMGSVGSDTPTESLEERSKASKVRLHYHKFTRGKDVSKYSKKDLGCILGFQTEPETIESHSEPPVEGSVGDVDNSHGVTTFIGGSIDDYLKKKCIPKGSLGMEDTEMDGDCKGVKSKKKRKKESEALQYCEEECVKERVDNIGNSQNKRAGKHKKVKKSKCTEETKSGKDSICLSGLESTGDSLSKYGDGSLLKKRAKVDGESSTELLHTKDVIEESGNGEIEQKSQKSRKKKLCLKSVEKNEIGEGSSGVTIDVVDLVSVKNHHRMSNEVMGGDGEIVTIKKKKKKVVSSVICSQEVDVGMLELETEDKSKEEVGTLKKKMKKSKSNKGTEKLCIGQVNVSDEEVLKEDSSRGTEMNGESADMPKKRKKSKKEKNSGVDCSYSMVEKSCELLQTETNNGVAVNDGEYYPCVKYNSQRKPEVKQLSKLFPGANLISLAGYGNDGNFRSS